ncbi:MAG TPA: hypothetical protein VFV67_00905 [Actinophytocola sp.]|uniref:hypothetical protein n=1 Tax=Actinophytocola sp. TaxID=1872138 RepID=UPI002DB783BC|nr:hypothetical protein [Actinophytocola sp.]HEU5469182.1 hypothetical protein [Actinophytocola sp.]
MSRSSDTSAGSTKIPPNPLRRLVMYVVGGILLIALVASFVLVLNNDDDASQCAEGVERHGPRNECVGLTDGSYLFAPELRDIQAKILAENNWVLQQGKEYVNMAYFEPMTLVDNDVTTYQAVRHGLQGAYLSQRRANRTSEWNGEVPLIRLLLANPGSQARQWEPVVDRIVGGQGATDKVVAVAGLGQSIGGTLPAAKRLSEHKILMVGSVITADHFSDVNHLARVVPTNTNEISAIVEHLKIDTKRAMLVQDINLTDQFATNLGEVFANLYPGDGRTLVMPIEEYESSDDDTNNFQRIAPEICFASPDAIFFAGRFRDLIRFLDVLAQRPCPNLLMRVVTGDTIVDLVNREDVRRSLAANIQLKHLHLAYSPAWDGSNNDFFPQRSTEYFTQTGGDGFFRSEFPNESLDDGLAILAFDAVGTAVSAIREGNDFTRLHGQSAVPGASGWISLNSGDPDRKAMSLLTLTAAPGDTRTSVQREVISCSGTPFQPRKQGGPDPQPCP